MWKANGSALRKPVDWLKGKSIQKLIGIIKKEGQSENPHFAPVKTQRGGTAAGTWGTHKVALAYAEYLSAEFHAWVLSAMEN